MVIIVLEINHELFRLLPKQFSPFTCFITINNVSFESYYVTDSNDSLTLTAFSINILLSTFNIQRKDLLLTEYVKIACISSFHFAGIDCQQKQ